MDHITTTPLPNRTILLNNFFNCVNWEEKYLYIIELGEQLPQISEKIKSHKHLVPGCQSQVWISVNTIYNTTHKKKTIYLQGDSDAAITKGILCVIFIIYQGLTVKEVINFNPYPFLKHLNLSDHLTYSRSQGIKSILQFIHQQVKNLYNS